MHDALLAQIEADMEEQRAEVEIQQAVSQTLPYAVLQVLGLIHNKTTEWPSADGSASFCSTMLNHEEFEYVSNTLQNILNLLGWQAVETGKDENNQSIVSLVPLGTLEDFKENEENV